VGDHPEIRHSVVGGCRDPIGPTSSIIHAYNRSDPRGRPSKTYYVYGRGAAGSKPLSGKDLRLHTSFVRCIPSNRHRHCGSGNCGSSRRARICARKESGLVVDMTNCWRGPCRFLERRRVSGESPFQRQRGISDSENGEEGLSERRRGWDADWLSLCKD